MSRKKTTITNNIIFVNNINIMVNKHGGKYTFAKSIGVSYDAVRQWCNGENLPDGKRLLAIRDKFGVSIDALLSGSDPGQTYKPQIAETTAEYGGSCVDSLDKWPEEVKNACRQMKKILESDHPVIKPALLSNLAAFQYSVDKEKSQDEEIRKLNERLKLLEDYHEAKQCTGTDEAASSSTGKPET